MGGNLPYQVIKSDAFAYSERGRRNRTLECLQGVLADSLNRINTAGIESTNGYSMHVVLGKGDWKFRREWLRQSRNYMMKDQMCPRCFASGLSGSDKPWFDPVRERFNAPADVAQALATRVGEIPLLRVAGWDPSCESADLLHCFWLGTARDATGSLLMDLAENHPGATHLTTWDARLEVILCEFHAWCRQHSVRPSTIEELSRWASTMSILFRTKT